MKEKILNETTTFCSRCTNRERCLERKCVLFRIEQIVLKQSKKTRKENK